MVPPTVLKTVSKNSVPSQNGSTKPSKALYPTALYRDPPCIGKKLVPRVFLFHLKTSSLLLLINREEHTYCIIAIKTLDHKDHRVMGLSDLSRIDSIELRIAKQTLGPTLDLTLHQDQACPTRC